MEKSCGRLIVQCIRTNYSHWLDENGMLGDEVDINTDVISKIEVDVFWGWSGEFNWFIFCVA